MPGRSWRTDGPAGARGVRGAAAPVRAADRDTFTLVPREYLQLQENMQRENREFTTLSNVMRVKHDSAKSAIQNIH